MWRPVSPFALPAFSVSEPCPACSPDARGKAWWRALPSAHTEFDRVVGGRGREVGGEVGGLSVGGAGLGPISGAS